MALDYTGLDYGENKQVNDQAAAAPLTAEPVSVPFPEAAPPVGAQGIFGPTVRPDEPMLSGTEHRPMIDDDQDVLLRALHAKFRRRETARLLARIRRG